MKKLNVILSMFVAGTITTFAQAPYGQGTSQRTDSLKIKANNMRTTSFSTLSKDGKDSTRHKLKVYKIDKNAVKMPKYDTFKEKMKKEPLAGDLLKDVVGNIVK